MKLVFSSFVISIYVVTMSVFHPLLLISINDSCLQVITLMFKDGAFSNLIIPSTLIV